MPSAWNDTIETHRRAVRGAILDAAADLVAEYGPLGVTMARIADRTGMGRATLYKYFPDTEAVLVAWHERQVAEHVEQLRVVRDNVRESEDRLEAVLEAFALNRFEYQEGELARVLHQGEHIARATGHLREFIRELLAEGAKAGQIRDDIASDELARYCLHSLTAASGLTSRSAVHQLVSVILAGLRPPQR
jgi:AcrR family transcriptional regulator